MESASSCMTLLNMFCYSCPAETQRHDDLISKYFDIRKTAARLSATLRSKPAFMTPIANLTKPKGTEVIATIGTLQLLGELYIGWEKNVSQLPREHMHYVLSSHRAESCCLTDHPLSSSSIYFVMKSSKDENSNE